MRSRSWLALVVLAACHGGGAADTRPPAEPPSAMSVATPAPDLDGGSGADAAPARPADEGMPRLAVVLDDPRLAAARERDRARDPSAAAKAVDAVLGATSLDPRAACAWSYVSGRLHAAAGEWPDAVTAYERVASAAGDAGAPCPLAAYASLRDAQALAKLGRNDDALARARAAGEDLALRDEVRLAVADALVAKGDRAGAVTVWRALLAAAPHGLRWADTSVQLATALLDGVDGPADAHAREALDLVTRVLVESPAAAEKLDLAGLRARAAQRLKLPPSLPLALDDRLRQAQAWQDAGQSKRAVDVTEALLKTLPRSDTAHRSLACKAATLRAQASPKGKSAALADAWGVAIERCDGDDGLASALYYGAKASASAHRQDEALDRFARVEKLFPTHRLADDARLRAAQIVLDRGDAARYDAMLASVPDSYPDGDMRGEALFRLALDRLEAHDLDGARAALDRAGAMPSDDHASAPGRVAYFRARVAQLAGDVADARTRYGSVVASQPLSFYMLLAYERLRALDEAAARAAVDEAVAKEEPGPFLSRPHPELESPAFDRFQRLLEVGELDAARREASAGGLTSDGVDPEVLWTVAWSYDRAGAPDLGHSFARARLSDFRAHWPAGRWRLPWEVAYPRAYGDVVTTESQAAGVAAPLTWAIMREESAFNPDAHSGANAIGLMQLLVGTGRQLARGLPLVVDEASLRRPEVSIALGARLLGNLRGSFGADPTLAIAAYNCGSSPVKRWLDERGADDFDQFVERIPYEETRNYQKRVLTSQAAYAFLYAPEVLRELYALPLRASGQ